MRKAAIYCRVSSSEQADTGSSLDTQEEACRKLAGELGYEVSEVVREDCSGGIPFRDRPKSGLVWRKLVGGEIAAIVSYDIDRFTRNDIDVSTFREAEALGDGVKFVKFEGTGPAAELMRTVRTAFAQYERQQIGERTLRGRNASWKKGKLAANAGFGLRWDSDSESWAEEPEQADVVRRIFRLHVEGLGTHKIVTQLNDDQVPPPAAGKRYHRTALEQRWQPTTVRKLLHNPKYRGAWPVNNGEIVIAHPNADVSDWPDAEVVRREDFPMIVPEDLWRTAQKSRKTPRNFEREQITGDYELIRGRVWCGHCGSRFRARSKRDGKRLRRGTKLTCAGRERLQASRGIIAERCESAVNVYAEELIPEIIAEVRRIMEEPAHFKAAVREYLVTLDERIEAIERILDPSVARQRDLEGRLERLGLVYVDGLVSNIQYETQKREIETALAKITTGTEPRVDELNELRVLQAKRGDFEEFLDLEDELRPLISVAVLGGKEEAIARLDIRLIVSAEGLKLEGRFPEDVLGVPATDPSSIPPARARTD